MNILRELCDESIYHMKTKTSAISRLCPTRQTGIATHVQFNASPGPKLAQVRHTRAIHLSKAPFSRFTGEDSLFLGGLGEGSVVGLGERANLTLLAVLFRT
jgi:hypothetical protein